MTVPAFFQWCFSESTLSEQRPFTNQQQPGFAAELHSKQQQHSSNIATLTVKTERKQYILKQMSQAFKLGVQRWRRALKTHMHTKPLN